MKITLRALVPVLFVVLLGSAVLHGVPEQQGIQVSSVGGKVSVLVSGRGGNIGVSVGDDGILMVDDLFPDTVEEVEKAVGSLAEGAPVFLVNTHWHGDHTGGNPYFGRSATIIAQTNVRRRLAGDATIGGRVSEEAMPAVGLPVITYDDGASIHFNGEEIRLFHVPNAHTDGDTVLWFTGSNVVHMGDTYFQLGYPFIDVESGGNVRGMIEGAKRVLDLVPEDARIIPGHGAVTGKDGLREYLDMLTTVTGRVKELLAEDFTVDEMMEAEVTKGFDDRWGGFSFVPPRRFVESVVASLKE